MPLKSGSSEKVISSNIRELHGGKTYAHTAGKFGKARANKQAVAIALSEARKGHATGGPAQGVAPHDIDIASSSLAAAAAARPLKRGGVVVKPIAHGKVTTGPLISSVPGRTDMHFTHVPSGSYVIPADIVSAHGEGNTLAGVNALHKRFKMGTYGKPVKPGRIPFHGITKKFGAGGAADPNVGKPVAVKLAGGEIVVPPENVYETMQRESKKPITLEQAHQLMDNWILNERKKLVGTLKKLPPPVRD